MRLWGNELFYGHLLSGAAAFAATGHAQDPQPQQAPAKPGGKPFQLLYAPHFGMFKHHAGEDLIDQLEFVADQGFTALEDNGMPNRPPEVQEKIAAYMNDLLSLGVAGFRLDAIKHMAAERTKMSR